MAFRFLTAGESHGEALTAVIDGVPAGLPLTEEHLNEDLGRRQRVEGRPVVVLDISASISGPTNTRVRTTLSRG